MTKFVKLLTNIVNKYAYFSLIWCYSLTPKTVITGIFCLKYLEIIFGTFLAKDYDLDGNKVGVSSDFTEDKKHKIERSELNVKKIFFFILFMLLFFHSRS